jgi:hypothetical protein
MGLGAGPTEVRDGLGLVSDLGKMGRVLTWKGDRVVCLLGLIEGLGRRAVNYNDYRVAVVCPEDMLGVVSFVSEVTVVLRSAVVVVVRRVQEVGSCRLDILDSLYWSS